MIRWFAAALLLITGTAQAALPILVVDLSEAYTRSSALAGLLAGVDRELQALAQRHRPELTRLETELGELKHEGTDSRARQLLLIRRINEIETAAEREQERLSEANRQAIAKVDAAIAEAKKSLKSEYGASAVLDIQETRYVRSDCPCLVSERLYTLLNAALPEVQLELDRSQEK